MCLTQDELLALVSAVERYNRHTGIFEYTALLPVLQAVEFIGRPEEAECYSGAYQGMDCLQYPAFASFVEYLPNDPYDPAAPIPEGYLLPAWWKWGELEGALPDIVENPINAIIEQVTQYKPNDAMVWWGSLPVQTSIGDLLEYVIGGDFPFPYIKIHVTGKGSARLSLLSMPFGGRVVCEVDQLPNIFDIISNSIIDPDSRVIDTDRDVTSFPLEQWPVIGVTLEIEEEGDHVIYVCPLPRINDGVDFFGYGAGLRGVELCGGLRPINTPAPSEPPPLEGVTELKPEFRLTEECGMEYRLRTQSGVIYTDWLPVEGWVENAYACFHGLNGEDGTDGEDGEDGEDGASAGGYAPTSPTKPFGSGKSYADISAPILEPETCDDADKSKLWAVIKALVYKVHAANNGLLDTFVSVSNPSDAYDFLSAYVPLVGGIIADTANSLALALATNFKTSYNSAVTEEFLMDVVEDLFCAAYDDCNFSLEDFVSYVAGMAGGSYNAAVNTFLDVTSALAGQTTGSGIFGALSWWQFSALGLGEKFGNSQSIPNMISSISGALPSDDWKAWATECYTPPIGTKTVILDFANDYVPTGSEIVYKNAFNLLRDNTGGSGSQGGATVTVEYGKGLVYSSVSSQVRIRELRIANAGCLFINFSLNARRVSGSATQFQIDADSNSYDNTPRNFASTSYAWSSDAPVANVSGTPAPITHFRMRMAQVLTSNSCVGELRYIKFTVNGELPRFI